MTPTYNQVMAWNPGALSEVAPGVSTLAKTLMDEAPNAGNPVLNLTNTQWTGRARPPADDRAEAITKWLKNIAARFQSLESALTTGSDNIVDARTALSARKIWADAEGYILNQDDGNYSVSFSPAKAPEGAAFDADTAFEHQTALHNLGKAADDAVTTARNEISAKLSAIGRMTPASIAATNGAIDSTLAAGDVTAIRNGTVTPEQRGRYLRAMRLTPSQLARLQLGERIDIDPSKLAYIQNAMNAIDAGDGDLTGVDAFDKFGTAPGDWRLRVATASGLQVVSNSNVHAGNRQGGFALLPDSIKDVVAQGQNRPLQLGGVARDQMMRNLGGLGKLISAGDARYQAGTDLDRSLGKIARNYVGIQVDAEQDGIPSGLSPDHINGLQDLLNGIGRDKMWVQDAFTAGNGDGKDFIHDLLTLHWSDDGEAAGQLWRFSAHDAQLALHPSGDALTDQLDLATSRRTSSILESMLRYAGSPDSYHELMNIGGAAEDQSVGQLNPRGLQTLAESLKPYVAELGGGQDLRLPGFNDVDPNNVGGYQNLLHTPGHDPSHPTSNYEGASRIFGLLATDETAAKTFYGEVYKQIAAETVDYAANPNAGDAAHRLALIAHLRGLADEGLLYAAHDLATNDFDAAQKSFQLKKLIIDDVFSASDLLTGKLTDKAPGSDILLGHVTDSLKEALLGQEPTGENFDPTRYKLMLQGDASETGNRVGDIRAAILAATTGDVRSRLDSDLARRLGNASWFNPDGSLRTREQILASGNNPEQIDIDIRTVLEQIAKRTHNSNPANIPADYGAVWDESEELDPSNWSLRR